HHDAPSAGDGWGEDRPPPGFGPPGSAAATGDERLRNWQQGPDSPTTSPEPAVPYPASATSAATANPGEHALDGVGTRGEIGGYLAVTPGVAGVFKNGATGF